MKALASMKRLAAHSSRIRVSLAGIVMLFGIMLPEIASAQSGAVVIMYHRFGENELPSTNIRLEQFEAHLDELTSGKYTVLPLPEVIDAIQSGRKLPDRTIVITMDDAYRSIYTEAWPRLRARNLPFTVFAATDPIDRGSTHYMTWNQLRELKAAGVTIANHTSSHGHMIEASAGRNSAIIVNAKVRLEAELGVASDIFAYPYGELSLAVRQVVKDAGFRAAFGQHSGVAHSGLDPLNLPRFSFNENFGGMDRFRLIVNALPLPVTEITPMDPLLTVNPPPFGFTVAAGIDNLGQLNCFSSHEGQAGVERLGESRIEVRIRTPFPTGRSRFNCTVPGPDGRWRWFGMQYYLSR
jgi:peptidoglycan/xylan/chitin deacetylase (PgdA/CDA1 family)